MPRRVPVDRASAARRGEFDTVERQRERQQITGAVAYDRGEEGEFEETEEQVSPRGRDAAATGFGARAVGASGREWNPDIPYPQVFPSNTTDEERPRTIAMGYDDTNDIVRVTFRPDAKGNSAVYEYYGVPPHVYDSFAQAPSPGRFIDDYLNGYAYARRHELEG